MEGSSPEPNFLKASLWGVTIRKCQRLTFGKIIIDLGKNKRDLQGWHLWPCPAPATSRTSWFCHHWIGTVLQALPNLPVYLRTNWKNGDTETCLELLLIFVHSFCPHFSSLSLRVHIDQYTENNFIKQHQHITTKLLCSEQANNSNQSLYLGSV